MPVWPLYRALVGIGLVCAVVIASAYQLTLPIIDAKRTAALERAVLEVLPGASRWSSFAVAPEGEGTATALAAISRAPGTVQAGFDADGALVGWAIEASGTGYQDVIRLLYGFSPAGTLVGVKVMEMRETPGLGDRIVTEEGFLRQFQGVPLEPAGAGLAQPLEVVKPGEGGAVWQIDAITGATISSRAVARIINESAGERLAPLDAARASFVWQEPEAEGG